MAAIYLIPQQVGPTIAQMSQKVNRARPARLGARILASGRALPPLPAPPPRPISHHTMAKLTILEFPDPRLRTVALPVDPARIDAAFQRLLDDMFETMYAAPGIGLAASQVDVHQRFMVIDVSEEKSEPRVFLNPQIVAREGEQSCQEGCLSVPGIYADVKRAERITVRALDRQGQPFQLEADGLLAICIQHEMDHLDGKLFVDYLSPLKRDMVKRKLAKQRRADAAA
jgi:peptide deformylase